MNRRKCFMCLFFSRNARERELAKFDENRRAMGVLNSLLDKNEGMFSPGGERKTPVTTACPESWKLKVMAKYVLMPLSSRLMNPFIAVPAFLLKLVWDYSFTTVAEGSKLL